MKKYLTKKSILTGYFVVASILIIVASFPVMKMGVLPKYFLIDLMFIIAIASITFVLPILAQEITQIVMFSGQAILLIVSSSLYLSRGDVFNWSLITQINQLKTVGNMIKVPIWTLLAGLVLIAGYVLLWIFLKVKKVKLKDFYSVVLICITAGCLALSSCGNVLVHVGVRNKESDLYFLSDDYMYCTFSSSYSSLKNFGSYGYYFEDLFRRIFPGLKPSIDSHDYEYEKYSSILNGLCEDNNVVMIYAESFDIFAISQELTPVLYSLKHGANLTQNGINDFYNVNSADGVTSLARKDFDKTASGYTFNSANIYENTIFDKVGLQLDNYMTHEYTDGSEMKALTGFDTECTYTIANQLDDYSSTYIHGNYGGFYKRETRMEQKVGFDRALFIEDMQDFAIGAKTGLNCYSMDSETMRHYTDDTSERVFPTDEKFLTFFMTITTHTEYEYSSYLDDNYALVDAIIDTYSDADNIKFYNSLSNNNLKEKLREYWARVLDTEQAMAYLVNYLYNNDILDKTIITFTGDHLCYIDGLKALYTSEVLGKHKSEKWEVVEGFVYSTNITNEFLTANSESRVISYITEQTSLVPTILTLLGREYKQDVYMGYAIINKSLTDPTKTLYNNVFRSYGYGEMEDKNFKTYDGINITIKNSNLTFTDEEIYEFRKNCDLILRKYYYVLAQRTAKT